jgi:hypothetical protein
VQHTPDAHWLLLSHALPSTQNAPHDWQVPSTHAVPAAHASGQVAAEVLVLDVELVELVEVVLDDDSLVEVVLDEGSLVDELLVGSDVEGVLDEGSRVLVPEEVLVDVSLVLVDALECSVMDELDRSIEDELDLSLVLDRVEADRELLFSLVSLAPLVCSRELAVLDLVAVDDEPP